ncbi:MAG: S-layer homology domain-containing protein, partial [Oscillospiraceae bacterium]
AAYNVTGTITDVGSVDNEFTYTLNANTKAANYNIDTVTGKLSVTPLTGVVVTITEHSSTVPFTGTTQTVTGYDVASSSELYKESDFTFNGNATAAGLTAGYYPMELKPADFTNINTNFKDVEFKIVDGGLTITPLDTIIVTITGNTATKTYNGFEQKVEGYTVSINSDLYTEDDFDFNGVAVAARTDVGKTMMGLKAEQFTNNNENFSKVAFNIVDGWLEITPNETELKVVANSNSWVYDGQDHADGGYTVTFGDEKYELKTGESATLSTGDTVTAVITKTVKHVSDTAEGNNEIVRLSVDNEDNYKTVTKLSGTLTITPAPLTITAGSSSQPYVDGVVMCNEYTNTPLVDGDKIESVKITGQQDGPGKSDNVPSDAVIKNAAGEDVTGDYDITYVNGVLEGVPKLEKDVHFNYIMGYKDETIRPNNNITRAEVATIFFRLLTDESREYYWKETNDFKDIPDNYWACPAISTLTNAGILKGFEDGNFRPNEPVTRAQMATIIARFANLSEGTVSFTDIEGHWAQRAIELAAGNGWINGYEDGTFRPNEKITRAATMAMINRVLDRHVENVEDLLPDMNVWSDNMDTSYTFYFDIQEATNFHECQRIDNSPNEKWTVKLDDIDWTVYEF